MYKIMTDLSCTDYSDKAIVVRGETKDHKEDLKKLGGKYNANLRDGPGWIFSKKNEDKVLSYIASGKVDNEDNPPKTSAKTSAKPAAKTPAKPAAKVGVNPPTNTTDLISSIEIAMKSMDLKERLTFLTNVSRLASSQPFVAESQEPVTKVQVTVKKRSSSSNEDSETEPPAKEPAKAPAKAPVKQTVKTATNPFDSDLESDEEVPVKRLLR